jgi:serine/threonine-protein kinase HipA
MAERAVEVHVQIVGTDFHAGSLWFHSRRGAESATFEYAPAYLASRGAYALDPELPLVSGRLQTPLHRSLFGAFSDLAPGSWARSLVSRARPRERFSEADHLLGVRDDLRQGSLRFRDPDSGAFLSDEVGAAPQALDLPRLLAIAEAVGRGTATDGELDELLRSGGSLGGSRPKVHVLNSDGRASIAKFPSAGDEWNVEGWEAATLELARRAGLDVADSSVHIYDRTTVLVVHRFDRAGRERVGYVSAMTLLEAAETERRSYLDLAEAIEEHSDRVTSDLHELWRRVAFSILVSNTDDHLRNHGFLRLSSGGWSLAPAFDLNPDPSPGRKHLSTSIDGRSQEASLESLFGVAEHFRLDDSELASTVAEVSAATEQWREVAAEFGLSWIEIEAMEPAFEHDSAELAREVARVAAGSPAGA